MPEGVLWAILGALCGWLGKAQLERLRVTEAYRAEHATRRVNAHVEVWRRLDLSLFHSSFYLEALGSVDPNDAASRDRLNSRSRKAKEVHDAFETALHENRLLLGDDFERLTGIHNRLVELDEIAMRRPIDFDKMREHVAAIHNERADLATIVKRSLRW